MGSAARRQLPICVFAGLVAGGCVRGTSAAIPDASAAVDGAGDLRTHGYPLIPDQSLQLVAIGDFGCGNLDSGECQPGVEAAVADLVLGLHPDGVIALGDDNYGSLSLDSYDAVIGAFYGRYIRGTRPFMAGLSRPNRFWPAPGNHDWYLPNDRSDAIYLQYFSQALGTTAHHWDADLGPVHLFSLDTGYGDTDGTPAETAFDEDLRNVAGPQAEWLRGALASSRSCFNVVFFHFPPYSSGGHAAPEMRWPFRAWGADVVLSGHEHFYERLRDTDGMTYLISGAGGADLFGFQSPPDPRSQYRWGGASTLQSSFPRHGALLMTVDTDDDPLAGTLSFELHTVGGLVLDPFTLTRDCTLPHPAAPAVDLGAAD